MPEHILSLSYGKDSLACLGAIESLGWPLDRIVHAEVWATDTIPAEYPPMVEFKSKADAIIKERYGMQVEHVRAKYTYEDAFYRKRSEKRKSFPGGIMGWPMIKIAWCNSELKLSVLKPLEKGDNVVYLGIAADEPKRLRKLSDRRKSPLAEAGWTEPMCREWCERNDLLSPIYLTSMRGGCWFCHNQPISELRKLRKNYPEYWEMMLKWDSDSPVAFRADGRSLHDYELRFALEDKNILKPGDSSFRWKMLDENIQLLL